MTAQEMFEESDFTLKQRNNLYIWYENESGDTIVFCINERNYTDDLMKKDMKTHKAINKQCKELGWIE